MADIDFKVNVDIETTGKNEVDDLEKQIENLKKASPIKLDIDITGDGANIAKYFTNIQKQAQTAGKGIGTSLHQGIKSVKFNGNLDDFTKSQVDMMNRVKKNTQKISKDVESTLNNATSKEAERASTQIAKRYETQMNNAEKQISAMNKKFQDNQDRLSKLQSDTGTDKYKNSYENTSGYKVIEENLKRIKTLQDQINSESAKVNPNTDKINADIKEMTSLLSKSDNAFNNLTKPISVLDASIASNKTLSWLKENSKAAKELGSAFEELAEKQKYATTAGELDNYNKQYKNLVSIAQSKGLTGKSAFDEFKRATAQIAQFTGIYGVLQNVMQDLPREMVQAVRDVDTAMTNLYKVTDETDAKYQSFLKNAGTTSKQLGRDMSSYITQTSEWAKLGYSMAESADLAKLSSIYANVGEVSDSTAVSDMVTAMKAFNIEASNAGTVIDSLNELGNNFATTSAELGEGLSKSASSMNTAGVDLAHTLAMLTGGAEITQNASEFGNFLKVASMRIRGKITCLRIRKVYTQCYA